MEDSFKVRVDRIFNSDQFAKVLPSASTDASLRSLWCLTDDEVEKKEWNRDKGSPEPEVPPPGRRSKGPADFRRQLEKDLEDLADGDLEEKEGSESSSQVAKPDDYNDEEWEIRSSIGRDCTLDYEEEEDQYDKVAVGKEKAGDRIFMHEINGYGIDMDHGDELPVSFRDATKDPRANHMAAKIRLQEDEEAAGSIDPLKVSKPSTQPVGTRPSEEDLNVKSILKRKDKADPKSQKRVRFDPQFIEDPPAESEDVQMESSSSLVKKVSAAPSGDFSSAVPDYLKNPSRYTQYVFDSSDDLDEQANRKACFDFLNSLKSSNGSDVGAPAELPKSITFVPRKKSEAAKSGRSTRAEKEEELKHTKASLVSIDDEDNQEDEVCAMEEDETESSHGSNGKSTSHRAAGRQYRMRAASDVDDD